MGIQCKLKTDGQTLKEEEVRQEVEKALTFEPPLSEYFIVTTAPDDTKLHSLAVELSQTVSKGRENDLRISVFGWGSLEREINRHVAAQRAFDASHTAMGDQLQNKIELVPDKTAAQVTTFLEPELQDIQDQLKALRAVDRPDTSAAVHSEQEQQINDCVPLISTDPSSALVLLQLLEGRLTQDTPGRIRFRAAANIAACRQQLGELEMAASGFIEAWKLAPDQPKAIANKAYGLLLKKDWSALRAFAEEQLPDQRENAVLAACYLSGLSADGNVTDPLSRVPTPVRDSAEVAEAYVRYLMKRGQTGDWWHAAISAHAQHPDNEVLEELYSIALLDRIQHGSAIRNDRVIDKSEFADASVACGVLASKWKSMVDGGRYIRSDETIVPFNLMVGYRLLGKRSEAVLVGTEALELFPEEQSIREVLGVVLAEQGANDRALQLLSELEVSERTAGVHFAIACVTDDWNTVRTLADDHLQLFPDTERDLVRAARVRAAAELAPSEQRLDLFKAATDQFRRSARSLTMLAEGARTHGFDEVADAYYSAAQEALSNGDDGLKARTAVAAEAMARREPAIAAEVLINQLPLDRHSPELYLLAQALVTDRPIRARALRFFEDLDSDVRSQPAYVELLGVLHFNRGAPDEAIGPFSEIFDLEPSIDNLMHLVGANAVCGNRDAMIALLQRDGVDALAGSPVARMNFCLALLDINQGDRALDVGYRALIDGLDDAEVVVKFMGLVLKPTANTPNHVADTVERGTWVQLTSSSGENFEALIDEADSRPWGDRVDPDNPFLAAALGLRVGETFENTNATTGITYTWTVAQVKPRWLQAFHHFSATFGQIFPDFTGFASLRVPDGDIDPVLSQVRRASERTRYQADFYLKKNLPVAFVAGTRPAAPFAFARYLVSIGEELRVCRGTLEERSEALKLITENDHSGAVLDAFTVWTAAELGLLPVLERQLGQLTIPAWELQQLKAMSLEQDAMAGMETMKLSYEDGKYIRDEFTADQNTEYAGHIKSIINTIEDTTNIQSVVIPDELSQLGSELIDSPMGESLAPGVLAGSDRLLVCEDMMMRNLAGEAFGTKGVWLQAVLISALDAGRITLDAYADVLVYLATYRHSHVSLDSSVLLSVFQRDDSHELRQLQALCAYVGNTNAEPLSHIRLAADFINEIWKNSSRFDLKVLKATSLIFRSLLCRNLVNEWAHWAALLCMQLNSAAIEFFETWSRGHFLPFEKVLEIVQSLANQEES